MIAPDSPNLRNGHTAVKPVVLSLRDTQCGAIMLLTALVVVILVALVSIVFNVGYSRIIRGEAQAAADAAAHAAASSLCSSKACWDDAKSAAIEILKQHVLHGMIDDSIDLNLDPAGGPAWQVGTLRVFIERGRLLPGTGFESFEGAWQGLNPGIPAHVAANAVRVKVERLALRMLLSPFGSHQYMAEGEAVATKGKTDPVCVAPFALPVCSIVSEAIDSQGNPTSEFNASALCTADRVFTRTDRYAPTGINNNILPEFFWYPTNNVGPALIAALPTYSWGNPRFAEVSDHFGVVGLPESAGVVSEDKIRNNILDSPTSPCVSASIGERFKVLEPGLTERATDHVLWHQISDGFLSNDQNHVAYSDVFQNTTVGTKTPIGVRSCAGPGPNNVCRTTMFGRDSNGGQPGYGACNSRRYVFNGVRAGEYLFNACDGNGFQPSANLDSIFTPAADSNTTLWKVKIPIIAEVGSQAASCKGMNGSSDDPQVDAAKDYVVIGFTEADIFDTDIGWDPPVAPTNVEPNVCGAILENWGFNETGDSTTSGGPCDLVRGRTTCDNVFIASSTTSGVLLPRLAD